MGFSQPLSAQAQHVRNIYTSSMWLFIYLFYVDPAIVTLANGYQKTCYVAVYLPVHALYPHSNFHD